MLKKTIAESFDQQYIVDPLTSCHLWQRACKGKEVAKGGGYGCFRLNGKLVAAHVYAWERVNGPVPLGMHILHSCDNSKCVNEKHLSPGTNAQNMAEKAARFLAAAKLLVDDVLQIRARVAAGEFQRAVAEDFDIHQADVSNIVNRKYWKHV